PERRRVPHHRGRAARHRLVGAAATRRLLADGASGPDRRRARFPRHPPGVRDCALARRRGGVPARLPSPRPGARAHLARRGAARSLDATLKAYLAMANAREPEKLWPHLGDIRCPVRLVVGGAPHEGDVGAAEVRLLQRTLRAFALDSVAGAGHFLYEEQPEAVVTVLGRLQASAARRL